MRLIGSRRVGAALFVLWLSGVGGAVAQSNLPPGSIPLDSVDSGDPAALVVRIDRLEDELRRANGQIEELQNQNVRLQEQFKRFREDVEFRLSGAKPSGGAAAPPPVALSEPPPVVKPRKGDAFDPALDPNAPGAPGSSARRPRARRSARRSKSSGRRRSAPRRSRPIRLRRSSPAASTSRTGPRSSSTRRSRPTRRGNMPTPRRN